MNYFESPELDLDLKNPEKFGNVAEKLNDNQNTSLASYVIELVKIDDSSMTEWEGKAQGYLDKADEDENSSAPQNREQDGSGEDQIVARTALMMSAAIQFTARITGSILSEPDLVKSSETGGEALAEWMSSQLRSTDPDWVVDTDPLIFHMSITGLGWRKRWFDDHDQIFRSTWLPSCGKGKVIINANAKSLVRVPRITHEIQKYPYEIQRSIDLKHWIDYEPQLDDKTDPQALRDFYEVDTWLDLDGDGKEEPWTVTVALDDMQQVVKINPRWTRKSIISTKDVLQFRPVRRYYAYRMIPDPKAKFFPHGFGWLMCSAEKNADRLLASIIDTAESAAENGGIAAVEGVGMPDKIELKGNRITTINTDGRPIGDMLSMFPEKSVSPGAVAVLEKQITLADRLAGTLNMLENAPASMTATLAKGIIDSGSQVQGAAHRRVIGEMTEEMRAFGQLAADMDKLPENIDANGVIAVSADPNMATEMHRGAIAQIYHDMLQMPMIFDPQETGMRFAQTLRLPKPDKLVKLMGAQGPNPEKQAEIAVKAEKNAIDRMKGKAQSIYQIAQAILALSQAGLNAQNAELVSAEVEKLNAAVTELTHDEAPPSNIQVGGAGRDGGPGSAPPMGGNPPGPTGGALPPGAPGGPGVAGPSSGVGSPLPTAFAAG